jgi:hypothetical protein
MGARSLNGSLPVFAEEDAQIHLVRGEASVEELIEEFGAMQVFSTGINCK